MKAQLSLEYLLLTVVVLGVLFFAASGLSKINNTASFTVDSYKFRSDAQNIFNKIDEVCILGNGNRFSIYLSSKFNALYPEINSRNIVGFNSGGVYLERKLKCPVNLYSNPVYGEAKIDNTNGIVELSSS